MSGGQVLEVDSLLLLWDLGPHLLHEAVQQVLILAEVTSLAPIRHFLKIYFYLHVRQY